MRIQFPHPPRLSQIAIVLIVLAVGFRIGIPIYFQRVAISELEQLGAQITCEYRGPELLAEWIGVERLRDFSAVTRLKFSGTAQVTDADLRHVQKFEQLENLSLAGTSVTDEGLKHLRGLKALTHLSVRGTRVTDAGMAHTAALTGLTQLDLCGSRVTDAGLEHLKTLTNLREVHMGTMQVSFRAHAAFERALPNVHIGTGK